MIKAKYTVVLKTLLDMPESKSLIDKAMNTYPLYEKQSKEEFIPSIVPKRSELNKKILDYYKYQEIGFETVARFADELEIALCEIMPYYNQLFFTADQDYNIIYNVDYQRTIDRNLQGENTTEENGKTQNKTQSQNEIITQTSDNSTNNTTATDETQTTTAIESSGKTVKSETPQGILNIPAKNIDSLSYADNVQWDKNNSTNNGTSTGKNTSTGTTTSTGTNNTTGNDDVTQNGTIERTSEDNRQEKESTLETTKGNFGVVSAQDLIAKYREIIINIEQKIINDPRIKELFMLVW